MWDGVVPVKYLVATVVLSVQYGTRNNTVGPSARHTFTTTVMSPQNVVNSDTVPIHLVSMETYEKNDNKRFSCTPQCVDVQQKVWPVEGLFAV